MRRRWPRGEPDSRRALFLGVFLGPALPDLTEATVRVDQPDRVNGRDRNRFRLRPGERVAGR